MKIKFKYILLILFLLFLGLYFSSNAGLIDYQAKYKKNLTEKQIAEFEEDIKNGVNIDLKDYIGREERYNNKISKATLKVSNMIGNTVKSILDYLLNEIDKSMNS